MPEPIIIGTRGSVGDFTGRVRLHGGHEFQMDLPPVGKLSKVLKDDSVQKYYKTGEKPKSKIPDKLPGIFD
jgi:hypothetical protein